MFLKSVLMDDNLPSPCHDISPSRRSFCSQICGRRALHSFQDNPVNNGVLQQHHFGSSVSKPASSNKTVQKKYRSRRFVNLSPNKEKVQNVPMSTSGSMKTASDFVSEDAIIVFGDDDVQVTKTNVTRISSAFGDVEKVATNQVPMLPASSQANGALIKNNLLKKQETPKSEDKAGFKINEVLMSKNSENMRELWTNNKSAKTSTMESKFMQTFKFLRDSLQNASHNKDCSLTDSKFDTDSDDDLIVVSKIDDNIEVTHWDIKRVVENIVSNTMLSNREALDNITAKQVAQRMKSLYHRDFSHRINEISEVLRCAKSKCELSYPQLQEVRPGLRSQDLATLEPGECLNDVIINKYLELLVRSTPTCCRVSSFFYEELRRNVRPALPENWFRKHRMLIPVCIDNHWSLICACVDQHELILYNSLPVNEAEVECSSILLGFIRSIFNLETSSDTDWSLRTIKDLPTQANAYDCGVYVCMFARTIVHNLSRHFGPRQVSEFRAWMRKELEENRLCN